MSIYDTLDKRTQGTKPKTCDGCALKVLGVGYVPPMGEGIAIIGDTPWVGSMLNLLERLLRKAGLDKNQFMFDSCVRCMPTRPLAGAPYRIPAVTHCGPNLEETLDKAKVIIAMGEAALERVGGEANIHRWRGRPFQRRDGKWVVPTLHPRDLLPIKGDEEKNEEDPRQQTPQRFTGAVMADLRLAVQIAKDGGFERSGASYLLDPTLPELEAWIEEFERQPVDTLLSWDIETPYKITANGDEDDEKSQAVMDDTIIRISFSYQTHTGTSFQWSPVYLPYIERLLASPNPKVVWNGYSFDIPRVTRELVPVAGEILDGRWLFHFWQSDLPSGLESATSMLTDLLPWKHLNNAEPALYSAIDSDAALRCVLRLRELLGRRWDIAMRHVTHLYPILKEAGENGSLIDREVSDALAAELDEIIGRLVKDAQEMVPDEVRSRKRYKRMPGVASSTSNKGVITLEDGRRIVPVVTDGKTKKCSICGALGVTKGEHLKGGKKNPCAGAEFPVVPCRVVEYDELLPFNPNSSEQIKAYIRHFKHPMGRDPKNPGKESANGKHLARLAKKFGHYHPIYALVCEMHKVSKTRGTYVYKPDERDLIHTTYDWTPSTGRLASKNVNLQNVGKRESNPWASKARRQIIARPGHVLVQGDSSAIEAVFVGYFMQDPGYIALARRSVHAYLACYKLGIEFTPENVALVKHDHKSLYAQCKVVVHGTGYGMGPGLMVMNNPEMFPTRRSAEEFQELLFEAVPRLKDWQHEIKVRAHKETYLENPWGYRHYFYRIFTGVNAKGELVQGDDAKRAIAFLPQSSAGAFMKDSILLLGATKWRQFMPAHLSVHDSLCLDVPVAMEEECVLYLADLLTRPIEAMGGLRVGAEIEVGKNWKDMDSVLVKEVE